MKIGKFSLYSQTPLNYETNLFTQIETQQPFDIGHYSDGEYMFWKDHWDYFFDQMRIIFNGENDFGSTIIITPESINDETSYPDAGSY